MSVYVYNKGDSTQGTQVQNFYSKIARKTIDQTFNFSKFANIRDMQPQGHGTTYKVSTYFWSIHREVIDKDGNYTGVKGGYITERDAKTVSNRLDNTQLTEEGVTDKTKIHALGTFRKSTFSTQIKKFAAIVEITEDEIKYSEDPIKANLAIEDATMNMNLDYNDLLLRDILNGEAVVYGGDAVTRADLGGDDDTKSRDYNITEALTLKVFGYLRQNKAKPMSSLIAGQNRIGTKPISSSFYVIVGADMYISLLNKDLFPDFIPLEQYSDPTTALKMEGLEEFGMLGRFRFLWSETMTQFSHQGHEVGDGSAPSEYCHSSENPDDDNKYYYDAYPAVVMAKDAISTIGLQGATKQEMYVRWPDVVDNGNPIAERGYIAYKFRYASVITRPDHLFRTECTVPIPN